MMAVVSLKGKERRLKFKDSDIASSVFIALGACLIFSVEITSAMPITWRSDSAILSTSIPASETGSLWTFPNILNSAKDEIPPEVVQSWSFDPRKEETILNWENKIGTDDKHVELTTSIVEVIVYIILGFVILSFLSFLVCICCPICVLAKVRHSRRGNVYSRPNGTIHLATTSLTNGSTAAANQRTNAPYPVQESLTVIPLIAPPPHPMLPFGDPRQPTFAPQPPPNYIQSERFKSSNVMGMEPPPPYPGFPDDSRSRQTAFNPYLGDPSLQLPEEQIATLPPGGLK